MVGKPLTKSGLDNYDNIRWGKSKLPKGVKIKFGKSVPIKGSLLTTFERKANEVVWDVLRSDMKKSLKAGEYTGTSTNEVFSLTGETIREILENKNPQGGD